MSNQQFKIWWGNKNAKHMKVKGLLFSNKIRITMNILILEGHNIPGLILESQLNILRLKDLVQDPNKATVKACRTHAVATHY